MFKIMDVSVDTSMIYIEKFFHRNGYKVYNIINVCVSLQ